MTMKRRQILSSTSSSSSSSSPMEENDTIMKNSDTRTMRQPQQQRVRQRRSTRALGSRLSFLVVFLAVTILYPYHSNNNNGISPLCVSAANDDYYNNDDNDDYYNNNNDDGGNNDDGNNDDGNNDDGNNDDGNNDDGNNDDGNNDDGNNDDGNNDDAAADEEEEQEEEEEEEDDSYDFDNLDFGGVSVMPVSCLNYNNGYMIKFELFDNASGYSCHFGNVGSFVVSIAHYMRAYFNYQALENGRDFQLPGDAGYLNCIMLQETAYSDTKLYAKIGCMDRQTFTSTKLQLHVYTDSQCSVPYDDGGSKRHHSVKGYDINGYYFSTHVSFRPPFYNCQTCNPDMISESFNKKNGNWYDDDYISQNGKKQEQDEKDQDDYYVDDYYADDQNAYMNANDDVTDDRRMLSEKDGLIEEDKSPSTIPMSTNKQLQAFEEKFWDEVTHVRQLYDNYYDIGEWNMCNRIYNYGISCDEECQALDTFRVDEWSTPDIFLLTVMCGFIASMMLLVLAKRLKAVQKARVYGDVDGSYKPGLSPLAMLCIFIITLGVIVVLAKLHFVNETLVFAVVTCVVLFIYMLKLTLFENKRPVQLATPRHDLFDNPMDDRLFD